MARTQIGGVWEYGNTAYDTTLPLPARTIAAGSLVVVVGRFEDDETTVTVSDTAGATWQVQTQFNTNIQVFIAWSYNHPGQVNNVITATLGSTRPYRIISAIELDGSDGSDPAQVANIVKSSAVLNHSMTVSTPCDIFAIQGCYSTSTITPTSPAVALTATSSVLCLFSTRRDVSSSPATIANTGGGGNQASISLAFSYPGGGPVAPTLTTPTAAAASATTSTGSVSTDQANGTLYWLTNTSSTATATAVKAGSSQAVTATGTQTTVSSGLTASTTYYTHFLHRNASGQDSTVVSSASFTTPTSDTTPPTMNGSITVGTKTSGSISISYPAASDNVAVTGYEVSSNGGSTWSDNSTSLSYTFLGLAALTSYNLRVRAYDAAGNRATTPLAATTSTYRSGDTAANIIANTGPVGGNPAGFLYAFASTVSSTDWLSYTILSGPTPAGGTLTANPDGTFTYVGPDAATMVIQPEVNGANAAETITVTLYDQNDVTAPTLSSPTGTKTGTTTATGTVSTNEADGTLYYYASTNATETAATVVASGSSQSVTTTGVQNVSFSGLSTGTTYYAHYVQDDSDLNRSARVSSSSFTTDTPDTTAPTLTSPTGTKTGQTTASGTVSTNEANGTLYRLASTNATETAATVIAAALSQAVSATGVQNVSFTGLTAATTYYAHYVHRDAASNDSSVASSASFTTDAAPDETAPTLSDPTAYASGPTTASGTVTTNEATGTLYFLRNNSATATDVAVKAGLSQAVTAAGIQMVNVTGLTASTPGNYIHYLHRDAAGNDSLVSSSAAFTTPAEPAPGVVSDEVGFRSCMRYPMESAIKGALA